MCIHKLLQGKIRGLMTALVFFLLLVFVFAAFYNNDDEIDTLKNTLFNAQTPLIPEHVAFCGESMPLHYFDVHEGLEREIIVNAYWHSQTIIFFKKAKRFFEIIEPILKENNIPDDFKYLPIIESGLRNVISPSGAAGIWQLLEGTAKDYDLEVTEEVDERYNLEKATQATCKYLNESYKKYKNWTLVAASFNAGRKGVDRQIEKQLESNYYDIYFTEETARYVYRIIAIKLIFEDPEKYGYHLKDEDLYATVPYRDVIVRESINDLIAFSKDHNTSIKMVKYLNPWLRDYKLTNQENKKYVIKIPLPTGRSIQN